MKICDSNVMEEGRSGENRRGRNDNLNDKHIQLRRGETRGNGKFMEGRYTKEGVEVGR